MFLGLSDHIDPYFIIKSIYLYSQVSQSKRDDCAKWTDEASGMY